MISVSASAHLAATLYIRGHPCNALVRLDDLRGNFTKIEQCDLDSRACGKRFRHGVRINSHCLFPCERAVVTKTFPKLVLPVCQSSNAFCETVVNNIFSTRKFFLSSDDDVTLWSAKIDG